MEHVAHYTAETILADIDASTKRLTEALEALSPEEFSRRPAEGAWSPAETAEHLLLTETGINRVLLRAAGTARVPDLKIEPVRRALEGGQKWEAPERIRPAGTITDREALIEKIRAEREKLKALVRSEDLTQTPEYLHPHIGDMTRLEWIYFNIAHADRHLTSIRKRVGG